VYGTTPFFRPRGEGPVAIIELPAGARLREAFDESAEMAREWFNGCLKD